VAVDVSRAALEPGASLESGTVEHVRLPFQAHLVRAHR